MKAEIKMDNVKLYVHITFDPLEPAVVSKSSTDHLVMSVILLIQSPDQQQAPGSLLEIQTLRLSPKTCSLRLSGTGAQQSV